MCVCKRSVIEAAVLRSVFSTTVNSKSNGQVSKLKPRCKIFKAKKFNREINERPSHKAKKRRFSGNRHTSEKETSHASTSAQKLKNSRDTEITIDSMHGYRIINFISVFSTLSALLKCKECESDVKFKVKGEQGLGFKLCVVCDCGPTEIESSPKISNQSFEINRRIVFVMRLLGIGLQGINLFCGMMDLGQGMTNSTYYACLENVLTAAKATTDVLLGKAAEEKMEKNAAAGNEPENWLQNIFLLEKNYRIGSFYCRMYFQRRYHPPTAYDGSDGHHNWTPRRNNGQQKGYGAREKS